MNRTDAKNKWTPCSHLVSFDVETLKGEMRKFRALRWTPRSLGAFEFAQLKNNEYGQPAVSGGSRRLDPPMYPSVKL